MPRAKPKNFHVPLSEEIYRRLREEADRTETPATEIARNAIESWLREKRRAECHEAIAAYARACAGSAFDLDPELESAGIEHLIELEDPGR